VSTVDALSRVIHATKANALFSKIKMKNKGV